MRYILVFAFLMLLPGLAVAEGLSAAELQQELRRACPRGFSAVNGKCTPPCEQGFRRDLAGRCVSAASCPQGQEMVQGKCAPKCVDGQAREGSACVAASPKAPPETTAAATDNSACPEGQERVGSNCKPKCLPKQIRDEEGICVTKCAEGQVRVGSFCQRPGQSGFGGSFNR